MSSRTVRPIVLSPWWWKTVAKPVAQVPLPEDSARARVEAVLLVSREPLTSRKLAELAGLEDGTRARTLCRELNEIYDARGSAFRVEQVAGGSQLLTRPQYHPWLRRLHQRRMEIRLSGPALETLAVVAYRQPVLRSEIENVRGVACGEVLRQLMDRDLVRIVGKSQELGRPFQYGTTKRFLQVFGLRDLDDLPQAARLRKQASNDEATGEVEPLDEELIVSVSLQPPSSIHPVPEDDAVLNILRAQSDDDDDDVEDEEEGDDDWDDDDEDEDDDWDDDEEEDDDWDEDEDEDWDDEDEDEDWDDDDEDLDDDEDDDEDEDWEEGDDEEEDDE